MLKETRERRCPSCRVEAVRAAGEVWALNGLIKSLYRCEACRISFFLVRAAVEPMVKREDPPGASR